MNADIFSQQYIRRIDVRLDRNVAAIAPAALRAPIAHVVGAGGKRIRPMITLLACEAARGKASGALDAAVAMELLHTFTLVHDDIMDNAALRRGRATVHTKWNANTAILAGDTIAALASQSLARTKSPRAAKLNAIFAAAFYDVCAGQALDKEQEAARNVAMSAYLQMIGLKTAAMFAAAAEIGGCIATADARTTNALKKFGNELGMAFQIRDDALDVDADQKKIGKDFGGDIREGKKTFLFIAAQKVATSLVDKILLKEYSTLQGLRGADVGRLVEFYRREGVLDIAETAINKRTQLALAALHTLPETIARDRLEALALLLTARRF